MNPGGKSFPLPGGILNITPLLEITKIKRLDMNNFENSTSDDKLWLMKVQTRLYTLSQKSSASIGDNVVFQLICHPRNLRVALGSVAKNRGKNSPGVDGLTMIDILNHPSRFDNFVAELSWDLENQHYEPSPVRRIKVPKASKPGEFRNLGIPTLTDRVIQKAMLQVLEPIFEAKFIETSVGFRPGRGVPKAIDLILNMNTGH